MLFTKEILTTYWSQFTLLLLAMGYLIKRVFDLKSKKIEINHTIFQQKKLESINVFFTAYAKVEQMWVKFPILKALKGELNAKEIDKMILPDMNELRRCMLELQIYFDENTHKNFNTVLLNMKEVNDSFQEIFFDTNRSNSLIPESNAFQAKRNEKFIENDKIFVNLSAIIKKNFN